MIMIEKGDSKYSVTEYGTKWVVKAVDGKVTLKFNVSKSDCATLDELKDYVNSNDLF